MKHNTTIGRSVIAAAVLTVLALPAQAFVALDSTRTTGNQGDFFGSLGMDFDVTSAISVTHLGAFDSGQDGFGREIQVGIFSRTTGLLQGVSATLSGSSQTLTNQNRFVDIADFVLGAGQYSIVAEGFGGTELFGNAGKGGPAPTINNGGGLISFTGGGRFSSTNAFLFPTNIDGGPANRYDAGTFQFVAAAPNAVPEPETLALVGIALAGLALTMRRR